MSDDRPNEPKLLIFSWVVSVFRKVVPAPLRRSASVLLFGITPAIPLSLKSILPQSWPKRAFASGIALGLFFCFVVIFVWTRVIDTYEGTDPNRLYFRHDYTNIVNYTLLCPLYIGLGATLIVLACQSWVNLRSDASALAEKNTRSPRLPIAVVFFVVIGLSAGLTCNYIRECLDPTIYKKAGWYIARIDSDGQRVLGTLGVYYSVMTYSLFLIVLSATVSLLLLFSTAAEVGRRLRHPAIAPRSFEELRKSLSHFVSGYMVAKLFAAVLMLNAFTWKASQARHSVNLIAMGTALSIGGIFFISIPRYYIEYRWYELRKLRARHAHQDICRESEDLRSKYVRLSAYLLDVILFGGFISSFWLR